MWILEREQYEALAEAEELEADARVEALSADALVALRTLNAYFARADSFAVLLERAESAEALALRHLSSRAGAPKNVLDALTEVHAVRMAVIDAQQRAASAACDLAMSAGVAPSDWPSAPE